MIKSCGGFFMFDYDTKGKVLANTLFQYILLFFIGAALYPIMEIAYRGYTHWSMAAAGGICLCAVHFIDLSLKRTHLLVKCIISATFITETEFLLGCILNVALKMNIWDYSELRFNVLGQICPQFTCVWFIISIPAFFISRAVSKTAAARSKDGGNIEKSPG